MQLDKQKTKAQLITALEVSRQRIVELEEGERAAPTSVRELEESERLYRGLFENSNDMLATFTLEGEITHVNRAVELTLGFTREELIGKYFIETQTPARSPYTEDRHRRARGCEKLSSSLKLSSSERMAPLSRSNVAPVLHRIKMGRLLLKK